MTEKSILKCRVSDDNSNKNINLNSDMKKAVTISYLCVFLFFLTNKASSAELVYPAVLSINDSIVPVVSDSGLVKKEKSFKNTIRYNTTNSLIFSSKTLVFGYERTIGKHQSFSIDVGSLTLPKLSILNTDSFASVSNSTTQKGIHASLDYRFYLRKENRYDAPRGVYIGPYVSYNYFERKNTWSLNTTQFQGDVSTNFKLELFGFGGELGYQFILWKRLAIDLVLIGPGLTTYNISTKLSTTLETEDQTELFNLIHDALADKIPGYDLVIDDLEYERSGSTKTTTFGFRYMINLGFRF